MELTVQVTALCLAGALLALVLRQGSPAMAGLLTLGIAAAVLLALGRDVGALLAFLDELASRSGVSRELLTPLYKTVGIALVVRIGGGLCQDAGESALAAAVETAGTVCALLAAMPLLEAVLELLKELMQ